jgi:putative transposase
MPFWRLFYHVNWPTKYRDPLITQQMEPELFSYLMKKANSINCHIKAIGGCEDHVHMVISIPPSMAVSNVVKQLKGSSSRDFPSLFWQGGYGVVTVSEKALPAAVDYVNSQKKHHSENTVYAVYETSDEVE